MAILGIVLLVVVSIALSGNITDNRACIAGGYAEVQNFNGTRVCIGIRDGAYTIESLDSVRLRLGLEER